MAFDVDDASAAAGGPGEGVRQSGEHEVFGLSAVGRGGLPQQRIGERGGQDDPFGAGAALGVAALSAIHWQGRDGGPGQGPESGLGPELLALRVPGEPLGPITHGGRLGGQPSAGAQGGEVLSKDGPGDGVDGDVVYHEQQATCRFVQHGPQQAPAGQVESGVRHLDGGVGTGRVCGHEQRVVASGIVGEVLMPAVLVAGPAEPQSVVVLDERSQGCAQGICGHGGSTCSKSV